ncbi:MAG: hypothetical protein IKY33_01475 [Clostridia bacterium]|nr:hypothetical protein [Clostridia bacterium]
MAITKISKTDFENEEQEALKEGATQLWHGTQADVPAKSAEEMKAFFDAPLRVFLDKINEIIDGKDDDGEQIEGSLKYLLTQLYDLQDATNDTTKDLETAKKELQNLSGNKQDILIAGENITIEGNVISLSEAFSNKANAQYTGLWQAIDALNRKATTPDASEQTYTINNLPGVLAYAKNDCEISYPAENGTETMKISAGSLLARTVATVTDEDGNSEIASTVYVFSRKNAQNRVDGRYCIYRQLIPIYGRTLHYQEQAFYETELPASTDRIREAVEFCETFLTDFDSANTILDILNWCNDLIGHMDESQFVEDKRNMIPGKAEAEGLGWSTDNYPSMKCMMEYLQPYNDFAEDSSEKISEIETMLDNVESALDGIIAIQNKLIGEVA